MKGKNNGRRGSKSVATRRKNRAAYDAHTIDSGDHVEVRIKQVLKSTTDLEDDVRKLCGRICKVGDRSCSLLVTEAVAHAMQLQDALVDLALIHRKQMAEARGEAFLTEAIPPPES